MEEKGTENIENALTKGHIAYKEINEIAEDGRFDFWKESDDAIIAVKNILEIISKKKELIEEVKDLNLDEGKGLVLFLVKNFKIENKKAEDLSKRWGLWIVEGVNLFQETFD